MRNMKKFSVIALLIVSMVLVATSALALSVNDLSVTMDDRPLVDGLNSFTKDDSFKVRVTFNLDGAPGEVLKTFK